MEILQWVSKILPPLVRRDIVAQQETKEMNAETAEHAGMVKSLTYPIPPTEVRAAQLEIEAVYQKHALHEAQVQIEKYRAQASLYAAKVLLAQSQTTRVVPKMIERHAVLHIFGEKNSMLLDFDVQVHMDGNGDFESLIIASADHSVTILRDEFKRRLEEGDMLCGIIYKRIVELKLLPSTTQDKPPGAITEGDFIRQNGEWFFMEKGKLTKVDQ